MRVLFVVVVLGLVGLCDGVTCSARFDFNTNITSQRCKSLSLSCEQTNCYGRGACINSTCICEIGFSGTNCETHEITAWFLVVSDNE